MITLGQVFNHEFVFTQEQVNTFAKVSGDNNPIHLDAEYAATTPFKRPIIHGIFSASIFSKYFGTINPGEGTIYLKQSLEFLRPMYVDTNYEAIMTVKEIDSAKNRAIIDCKVIDKTIGKATISGEAVLMHKEKIK
jgi:acyl dehydratase